MKKTLSILLSIMLLTSSVLGTGNIRDTNVTLQDTEIRDAFGRLRTAGPWNIYESQFTYDLQPLFFEESATGTGDVTHVPNSSAARLTTGGTVSGNGVIFQTKQYFRYQPGKSQFVAWTCILGAKTADVRKRIGLFDADNGFFFEQDGTNAKVVRRSSTSGSAVDTITLQANWNIDNLDGDGDLENPSGFNLNEALDNLFVIDYQWLGAGRIRYGFDFGGQITYVHQEKYANTASVPFTVTGNLPFRVEIFNTATAAGATTMDFTCVAVASEGGFNPTGVPGSAITQPGALREVTTANDPLPVISIRPRATFNSITNRSVNILKSLHLMSEDATVMYQIILNGSLTGASFANVNTIHSTMMVDVAATAITGGLVLDSGFLTGAKDKKESGNIGEELMNKLALVNDIAGTTTDILTIAVSIQNTTGTSSDCGGSFTWKEER